jgi:hypothetical protein
MTTDAVGVGFERNLKTLRDFAELGFRGYQKKAVGVSRSELEAAVFATYRIHELVETLRPAARVRRAIRLDLSRCCPLICKPQHPYCDAA